MDRLALAQFVRRRCGISGSETTTANASGEWATIVNAVDDAHEEVQLEREDWLFLRKSFSFVTVAQQGEYAPGSAPLSLSDFSSWVDDQFTIYKTSITNERRLEHWKNYDAFRNNFLIGSLRTQYNQPTTIVIAPNKSLVLGQAPEDNSYTVQGFYWRTPAVMASDTDEPIFPDRFHKIIAYKAIMIMAVTESASELFEYGQMKYQEILSQLERDQLPQITDASSFL